MLEAVTAVCVGTRTPELGHKPFVERCDVTRWYGTFRIQWGNLSGGDLVEI